VDPGRPYSNTKHQVSALESLRQKLPDLTTSPEPPRKQQRSKQARQLDTSEVQQLIETYQAGSTVYELAAKFDIGHNTVCRILHRHNVPMRRRGLSPQQLAHAAQLYTDGTPTAELASAFHVDERTMCRGLHKHGITLRSPHRPT
jgi:transposase